MEAGKVSWLAWYNLKGIKEKTAVLIARIIFAELDTRTNAPNSQKEDTRQR